MIKVLQIVDNMSLGGIQSFIMNVYRNINRNKIQFDFLLHHKYKNSYEKEIKLLGGNVYYISPRKEGILKNRKSLNDFFKSHCKEYVAVHLHESSLSYIEPLIYAQRYNIPIRIIHSHSTKIPSNVIHKMLHFYNQKRIEKFANRFFACGKLAGEWMYKNSKVKDKYEIIYNGIELEKFKYNQETRNKIRNELSANNKKIIGHVGRFERVKNHQFLLEILQELIKIDSNYLLLLVGDGKLLNEIKFRANSMKLNNNIKFLGKVKNVQELFQAFDIFVLPSFYEGFPVTAIEAQASGLPCILSSSITQEAKINSNVRYVGLKDSKNEWIKLIQSLSKREIDNQKLFDNGFDIKDVVIKLQNTYLNLK